MLPPAGRTVASPRLPVDHGFARRRLGNGSLGTETPHEFVDASLLRSVAADQPGLPLESRSKLAHLPAAISRKVLQVRGLNGFEPPELRLERLAQVPESLAVESRFGSDAGRQIQHPDLMLDLRRESADKLERAGNLDVRVADALLFQEKLSACHGEIDGGSKIAVAFDRIGGVERGFGLLCIARRRMGLRDMQPTVPNADGQVRFLSETDLVSGLVEGRSKVAPQPGGATDQPACIGELPGIVLQCGQFLIPGLTLCRCLVIAQGVESGRAILVGLVIAGPVGVLQDDRTANRSTPACPGLASFGRTAAALKAAPGGRQSGSTVTAPQELWQPVIGSHIEGRDVDSYVRCRRRGGSRRSGNSGCPP